MPLDPPSEFQFEEYGQDDRYLGPALADQFVNVRRGRTKEFLEGIPHAIGFALVDRPTWRRSTWFPKAFELALERGENVVGRFGKRRAVANETVRAFRTGIERGARHRENLAALLQGIVGRDQGARALRRFDNNHASRKARDDAIAARKMARLRRLAKRHFG